MTEKRCPWCDRTQYDSLNLMRDQRRHIVSETKGITPSGSPNNKVFVRTYNIYSCEICHKYSYEIFDEDEIRPIKTIDL